MKRGYCKYKSIQSVSEHKIGLYKWSNITSILMSCQHQCEGNGHNCIPYNSIDERCMLFCVCLQTKYYRFSIAWTRVMPDGTKGNINERGISYYNNLINALVDKGKLSRRVCCTININWLKPMLVHLMCYIYML